ncbi:MAG TPA: pyrroloquinoline quinone-dependent dehydrogenase [Gemmatimonadales bacterium]|nr:pyrroloquinoline quinone-dependent dehydrogenase [Gemmatimonadales bacterium]
MRLRHAALAASGIALAATAARAQDWPVYTGDLAGTRYSTAAEITTGNVDRLKLAWTWQAGEAPFPRSDSTRPVMPGDFETTPLAIGDVLYVVTPYSRVVALDASRGTELWAYDTEVYRYGPWGNSPSQPKYTHRGVAAWSDGHSLRILVNARWRLIALDAVTGRPVTSFGHDGEVDLTTHLSRPIQRLHFGGTSPPLVVGDVIIVGSSIGDDLIAPDDPPGDVQAFDARTGRHLWTFHTVPQAGEPGSESWRDGSNRHAGHVNVWAPMSADVKRGLVYLPVSTSRNDYYGARRKGENLFAESIVCLDARTGRRVWHYQIVHHGLWDYDLASTPLLATIRPFGKPIDVVVVLTKTGFAFVFDRVTGRPVWPIEERPVPASDAPGEESWPTQPVPTLPAPFARQGFGPDQVADFTPEIRRLALAEMNRYRWGPLFLPPSVRGTIDSPGYIGGAGWGAGSYDPETGTLYVKASNQPTLVRLTTPPGSADRYIGEVEDLWVSVPVEREGGHWWRKPKPRFVLLPLAKPPYGTLTAIDLNTGRQRWQIPIGDDSVVRHSRALQGVTLPPLLGSAGVVGGIVTAGGLVFIGADQRLYALDKKTGRTLWAARAGSILNAVPMTYRTRAGKQFVVLATGRRTDARLVAFALDGPPR